MIIQERGPLAVKPVPGITEMIPVRESRIDTCSYCGKQQRILHLLKNANSGIEAPVCFPCSRNGFGWLISRFPGSFFGEKRPRDGGTGDPHE